MIEEWKIDETAHWVNDAYYSLKIYDRKEHAIRALERALILLGRLSVYPDKQV